MLDLVLHVEETSLLELERSDRIHGGIIPADRKRERPVLILHIRLLPDFRRDVRDLRQIRGKRIHIFLGEPNLHSRLLTARLHGSFSRHNNDELRPEVRENIRAGLPKAVAVSQQHDDGRNAPRHAQHSQRRASPVVTHRVISFLQQIANHSITPAVKPPRAAASQLSAPDIDRPQLPRESDSRSRAWPTSAPISEDRTPADLALPPSSPSVRRQMPSRASRSPT